MAQELKRKGETWNSLSRICVLLKSETHAHTHTTYTQKARIQSFWETDPRQVEGKIASLNRRQAEFWKEVMLYRYFES